MAQNKKLITIPQAARYCSVSRVTLWRWVKSGKVKAFLSPGGQYKIREKDLESFIFGEMGYLNTTDLANEKKILIVDDDPEIQNIIVKILSKNGYRAASASDGLDAGIKIAKFGPDLIILDLLMPHMDGFEVCRRIKGDRDHFHIKIIILTGYDTPQNRERILEAGADAYLSKPVRKDDLLEHIENLLSPSDTQTTLHNKEVMLYD
ncbi:MAG: response regulator [Desulfobacterales bacterium]|nr:MAG: response regulator [Desulfobacterales bacterium]UCD89676.1 MAG: response regulator [Desulfobacterales bacterium]